MTPEERFERIEKNLERLTERMTAFEDKRELDVADWRLQQEASRAQHEQAMAQIRARQDAMDIEFAKSQHTADLRYKQLLGMQAVLMDAQTTTWDVIQALGVKIDALGVKIDTQTENINKLIQSRGPNGHAV